MHQLAACAETRPPDAEQILRHVLKMHRFICKTSLCAGITRERLESFDRKITEEPQDFSDKRDSLIADFQHYLGIIKAVHEGADLQVGGSDIARTTCSTMASSLQLLQQYPFQQIEVLTALQLDVAFTCLPSAGVESTLITRLLLSHCRLQRARPRTCPAPQRAIWGMCCRTLRTARSCRWWKMQWSAARSWRPRCRATGAAALYVTAFRTLFTTRVGKMAALCCSAASAALAKHRVALGVRSVSTNAAVISGVSHIHWPSPHMPPAVQR